MAKFRGEIGIGDVIATREVRMTADMSPEDKIRAGARRRGLSVAELEEWTDELQRTTIDALQAMGDLVRALEARVKELEER